MYLWLGGHDKINVNYTVSHVHGYCFMFIP